jgi:hypothetical protein
MKRKIDREGVERRGRGKRGREGGEGEREEKVRRSAVIECM